MPDGARLGIVVLGASRFPQFPSSRHLDNEAFARSAAAFLGAFALPQACLLGEPAVLDLFDTDDEPGQIVRRIKAFLAERPELSDVVLYYCGHGDFLADAQKSYILTIRATEPDNEAFTALPLRQMRLSLDAQLATKRVFIILDCCFAGRAATEWQADGLGHVIEDQVFQSFPKRGTALIAASAKGMPAIAPEGEALTMFTGALVEAIRDGIAGNQKSLSFRDVFGLVRARVIERYGSRAAVPVIHAPQQPEGDISFDPFFANAGYRPPPEPEATRAEREMFDFAVADLERPLVTTRAAAIQVLAELLASARSPRFRNELIERLGQAATEDDSHTVRGRAQAALEAAQRVEGLQPPEPTPPPLSNPAPALDEAERGHAAPAREIVDKQSAPIARDESSLDPPASEPGEGTPWLRTMLGRVNWWRQLGLLVTIQIVGNLGLFGYRNLSEDPVQMQLPILIFSGGGVVVDTIVQFVLRPRETPPGRGLSAFLTLLIFLVACWPYFFLK